MLAKNGVVRALGLPGAGLRFGFSALR